MVVMPRQNGYFELGEERAGETDSGLPGARGAYSPGPPAGSDFARAVPSEDVVGAGEHLGPARAVLAVCRGPAGLLWGAPARTAAPGPHLPWGFSGSASSHAIRAGSLTTPTGGRALEEQRRTGLVPPTRVSQTDRGWELHGCTVLILVP